MPIDSTDYGGATDVSLVPLGTVTIPANGLNATIQINPDQQTLGLGLLVYNITQPPTIQVQGAVSQTVYFGAQVFAGGVQIYWVRLLGIVDNPLTVLVQVPAILSAVAAKDVLQVVGMRGAGVQVVGQSGQDVWRVAFTNPFLNANSQFIAQTGLGAGASATLVPGVAGQVITVLAFDWHFAPAAVAGLYAATMCDTNNHNNFTQIMCRVATAVGVLASPVQVFPSAGGSSPITLDAGAGLRITNQLATGPIDVGGFIVYTQG